jgi:hypothetical protein
VTITGTKAAIPKVKEPSGLIAIDEPNQCLYV